MESLQSHLSLISLGITESESDTVSLIVIVLDHASVVVIGTLQGLAHIGQTHSEIKASIASVRVEETNLNTYY